MESSSSSSTSPTSNTLRLLSPRPSFIFESKVNTITTSSSVSATTTSQLLNPNQPTCTSTSSTVSRSYLTSTPPPPSSSSSSSPSTTRRPFLKRPSFNLSSSSCSSQSRSSSTTTTTSTTPSNNNNSNSNNHRSPLPPPTTKSSKLKSRCSAALLIAKVPMNNIGSSSTSASSNNTTAKGNSRIEPVNRNNNTISKIELSVWKHISNSASNSSNVNNNNCDNSHQENVNVNNELGKADNQQQQQQQFYTPPTSPSFFMPPVTSTASSSISSSPTIRLHPSDDTNNSNSNNSSYNVDGFKFNDMTISSTSSNRQHYINNDDDFNYDIHSNICAADGDDDVVIADNRQQPPSLQPPFASPSSSRTFTLSPPKPAISDNSDLSLSSPCSSASSSASSTSSHDTITIPTTANYISEPSVKQIESLLRADSQLIGCVTALIRLAETEPDVSLVHHTHHSSSIHIPIDSTINTNTNNDNYNNNNHNHHHHHHSASAQLSSSVSSSTSRRTRSANWFTSILLRQSVTPFFQNNNSNSNNSSNNSSNNNTSSHNNSTSLLSSDNFSSNNNSNSNINSNNVFNDSQYEREHAQGIIRSHRRHHISCMREALDMIHVAQDNVLLILSEIKSGSSDPTSACFKERVLFLAQAFTSGYHIAFPIGPGLSAEDQSEILSLAGQENIKLEEKIATLRRLGQSVCDAIQDLADSARELGGRIYKNNKYIPGSTSTSPSSSSSTIAESSHSSDNIAGGDDGNLFEDEDDDENNDDDNHEDRFVKINAVPWAAGFGLPKRAPLHGSSLAFRKRRLAQGASASLFPIPAPTPRQLAGAPLPFIAAFEVFDRYFELFSNTLSDCYKMAREVRRLRRSERRQRRLREVARIERKGKSHNDDEKTGTEVSSPSPASSSSSPLENIEIASTQDIVSSTLYRAIETDLLDEDDAMGFHPAIFLRLPRLTLLYGVRDAQVPESWLLSARSIPNFDNSLTKRHSGLLVSDGDEGHSNNSNSSNNIGDDNNDNTMTMITPSASRNGMNKPLSQKNTSNNDDEGLDVINNNANHTATTITEAGAVNTNTNNDDEGPLTIFLPRICRTLSNNDIREIRSMSQEDTHELAQLLVGKREVENASSIQVARLFRVIAALSDVASQGRACKAWAKIQARALRNWLNPDEEDAIPDTETIAKELLEASRVDIQAGAALTAANVHLYRNQSGFEL